MTFRPDGAGDPFPHGFRALGYLNEDRLGPKMVLAPPCREDVDIVTYVLQGTLIYRNRSGRPVRLETGEFRISNGGGGSRLDVLNGSRSDAAHVFQCALTPGRSESGPEQKRFPTADREGVLHLVASPDARSGTLRWNRDVLLYSSVLLPGQHLIHEVAEGRGAWLHVVTGTLRLREQELGPGDGAAYEGESSVALTAREAAEILLFDLG